MSHITHRSIIALLLALALLCAAVPAAFAEQEESVSIGYGVALNMPSEYGAVLNHTRKVYIAPVTEVFSVNIDGREVPLYRVDFANEEEGEWLGVLQAEEGDIPVTYSLYTLSEEELAVLDEEALDAYYGGMESFNNILEAIQADPRFTAEPVQGVGAGYEAELKYWTVVLPEKVTFEETIVEGSYEAVFYGRIQGEKTALYSVAIGDDQAGAMGKFNLDGEEKAVSVEIYGVEQNVFWSDAEFDLAYAMMDTVNDVIEAVMESDNFSN